MVCILNVHLYLTLEKERESVIKEAIEQIKQQTEEEINEEELAEMISEADHIHNKAIFDCVNEAMNFVRPFGLQGEPMPWSKVDRKNWFNLVDDSDPRSVNECLNKILGEVKDKVLKWASMRAGQSGQVDSRGGLQKIFQDQVKQKSIEEIIRQEEQEQQWSASEHFST